MYPDPSLDAKGWVTKTNKRPMGWGEIDVADEIILDYGGSGGISYLYHSDSKEVHYIESLEGTRILQIIYEGSHPEHREIMNKFISKVSFHN